MKDQIIQFLQDLYSNHTEIIITAAITFLLTQFGPALYSGLSNLVSSLGGRIGGRLAYKHIEKKYLNWVVLQYQDLNLTGIIGSDEKPRLEQVFISLRGLDVP